MNGSIMKIAGEDALRQNIVETKRYISEHGGSGHTILNSSGTSMPQRINLQFSGGLTTSDDSVNGKTVVSVPQTTFNGRSGSVLPMAGDYDSEKIFLASVLHIGGETQNNVQEALEALEGNKTDKVDNAIADNFAGLDANGNLKDSGKNASDFATPSDIAGQQSLLKDTVGWTGKNLLLFPFPNLLNKKAGDSITQDGIVWTINSDNSITATGTGTGNGQLNLSNRYDDNSCLKLKQGKYIISGCSASLPINIHLGYTNNGAYADVPNSTATNGSESTFEITDSMLVEGKDYATIAVYLQCRTQTVNNFTFYPMIRHADITDPTYEPYHENVETVYREVAGVWTTPVSCLVGDTTCTITNSAIHTTSTIRACSETSSGEPVGYKKIVATEGQAVITFASALTEAANIKLNVLNV